MDFICYRHPGWNPQIRPAESTRPWMDATPEQFAYRCLPLNIANAHGWEVLSPCDVQACWTGGRGVEDVLVRVDQSVPQDLRPVSLFGQGTITFHIQGLFRTPPGWNLWVGGSPNRNKDAIAPLTGVVETDWSPYTFTMNWQFTRRNHWVRFAAGEPICFVFPVQRDALENLQPKFVPMESAPDVMDQFRKWSESRNAFQAEVTRNPPRTPADKWQKRYYRGLDMHDRTPAADHRSKLRLKPFVEGTPSAEQTVRLDIAPERLGEALAGAVKALRNGAGAAGAVEALTAAGIPEEVADAVVARAVGQRD